MYITSQLYFKLLLTCAKEVYGHLIQMFVVACFPLRYVNKPDQTILIVTFVHLLSIEIYQDDGKIVERLGSSIMGRC